MQNVSSSSFPFAHPGWGSMRAFWGCSFTVHLLPCVLPLPALSTVFLCFRNRSDEFQGTLAIGISELALHVYEIAWNWNQWSFSTSTDASSQEAGQGSKGGEESGRPGPRTPHLRILPVEHKPSPEQGWVGNEIPAWCPSPVCPLPLPPGIGYASQMIVTLLNIYYIIVLAWALFYLFSSFTVDLPWGSCRHDWNTGEVTPSCLASVTGERDRPYTLGPRPPPLIWDALEVFQGHHGGLTPKIRARIHQHHRENVTDLFSKSNFTYLFFACAGSLLLHVFFSLCGKRGYALVLVPGFLIAAASIVGEHGL